MARNMPMFIPVRNVDVEFLWKSSGYEQYIIKVSAYDSNKNVAKQGEQKAVEDVAGAEHRRLKRDACESGKENRASPNILFKPNNLDTTFKNPV